MNFKDLLNFCLDHIDVIVGFITGLFGGMQIEEKIIKNKNNVTNSPGATINNGGINEYKSKK